MTAFHTILAKIAAVLQGVFLVAFFFWPDLPLGLFYAAVGITGLQLLEETIMIILIPAWRADVKGLYWYYRERALLHNNKTLDHGSLHDQPDLYR